MSVVVSDRTKQFIRNLTAEEQNILKTTLRKNVGVFESRATHRMKNNKDVVLAAFRAAMKQGNPNAAFRILRLPSIRVQKLMKFPVQMWINRRTKMLSESFSAWNIEMYTRSPGRRLRTTRELEKEQKRRARKRSRGSTWGEGGTFDFEDIAGSDGASSSRVPTPTAHPGDYRRFGTRRRFQTQKLTYKEKGGAGEYEDTATTAELEANSRKSIW